MNTKTPHKHCEVIKAWADGAEIEAKDSEGYWHSLFTPTWGNLTEYRIKPEPKPDDVLYAAVGSSVTESRTTYSISEYLTVKQTTEDNLKLTFDGETNKLIKAEVI